MIGLLWTMWSKVYFATCPFYDLFSKRRFKGVDVVMSLKSNINAGIVRAIIPSLE